MIALKRSLIICENVSGEEHEHVNCSTINLQSDRNVIRKIALNCFQGVVYSLKTHVPYVPTSINLASGQ